MRKILCSLMYIAALLLSSLFSTHDTLGAAAAPTTAPAAAATAPAQLTEQQWNDLFDNYAKQIVSLQMNLTMRTLSYTSNEMAQRTNIMLAKLNSMTKVTAGYRVTNSIIKLRWVIASGLVNTETTQVEGAPAPGLPIFHQTYEGRPAPAEPILHETWVVGPNMVWQLMFNDGEAANVLISKRDSETWRQGAPSDFGLTNLSQVWMPFNRSIGDGLPANYNSSQLFHLIDQSYDPSTGLITLTYVQVHQFLPPGRIGRMEFVYELKLDGGLRIYRESFKALGGPDGTLNFEDAEYSGFEKSNGIWFPTSIHQRVWMEAGKQLYMDNSLTISDLIVNGKLPPDTFVFTPPTGAIMTNFSTNVINSPPPFYENGPSVYEPYTVTTLAGSAKTSGSEDGVGSAAEFNDPVSVAVDNSDNIYVADLLNDTIRKITPDGMVTTFAGRARHKGSADGSGRVARFDWPGDVAVDGVGNVYVSDYKNDTIRTITPDGMVTTLAGQAGQEGSADGAGNTARFDRPCGLAVDSAGNVYVADYGNDTIRKISPDGMVTTLAGQAGQQGSTDGMGRAARFYHPTGVAVDGSGNVYVADDWNNLIRKITPAGVVTTFAGLANSRGSTDGKGNAARFDSPNSIAVDSAGNLYVTDQINNTIRKITPAEVVTTLAGLAGSSGSADGTGSAARFYSPCGMAIDGYGNLYVADAANNTIRKLTIQK